MWFNHRTDSRGARGVRGGLWLLLALLAWGCGDGESSRPQDGDTSGGAGGESSEGGASGSAAANDDRILPLEVGRTWTFERKLLDSSQPGDCESPLEASVPFKVKLRGAEGYDYHPVCAVGVSYYTFIDGDDVWVYSTATNLGAESALIYAQSPVEEGHSWNYSQSAEGSYVWHSEGEVTVKAGTFDRCWRRSVSEDAESYAILCRGVGPVLIHNVFGNFQLELAEKNF